ncbi:hypothetical protein OOK29_24270 [Streptomyces phaeochromogenes]|nr:hypothetical protein [Streptomyces phaeochromogenes]MCX5601265.1 hypothetical protein [Streptomyces phaeochromogenes]
MAELDEDTPGQFTLARDGPGTDDPRVDGHRSRGSGLARHVRQLPEERT